MNCNLSFFSASDVGKKRQTNQDSLGFDPKGNFFTLADGMGGHNGGEVASAMAVHLCLEGLTELIDSHIAKEGVEHKLIALVERVNHTIFEASHANPALQGMGSTVVLGIQIDNMLHYCHVGDSRLYLLRNGLLQPLTQDHSLQQEMIDKHPEDMKTIQRDIPNNIVTQALGVSLQFKPSYGQLSLKDYDLLLASSDGLHGAMDHSILEEMANKNNKLSILGHKMVDCANDLDGSDNISVLLARVSIEENPIKIIWHYLQKFFIRRKL